MRLTEVFEVTASVLDHFGVLDGFQMRPGNSTLLAVGDHLLEGYGFRVCYGLPPSRERAHHLSCLGTLIELLGVFCEVQLRIL